MDHRTCWRTRRSKQRFLARKDIAIRVRASGLNAADWHIMRADPFLARIAVGLRKPRHPMIIGSEVAGIVEGVGDKVSRFSPGDSVYVESMMKGGCAELIVVPQDRAARMPSRLTFEQAAAVPMAGVTALVAVRDEGRLQAGPDRVDQWRLWRGGDLRRSDRSCARREGHSLLQLGRRRAGPVSRRRRGHRLHRR